MSANLYLFGLFLLVTIVRCQNDINSNLQPLSNSSNQSNSTNSTTTSTDLPLSGPDVSWLIVASLLVMVMTPSLGFFYGGLVKTKNMISMMGQCLAIFSVTTVVWTLIGFSLTFGPSNGGLIGDASYFALQGVNYQPHPNYGPTIQFFLFYFFQTKFACITPALIIGSTAERVRFTPMVVYSVVWVIVVYCPIAHWNWNANGWLSLLGTKDFAGGNVIHISSGVSALAIAFVLDRDLKKKSRKIEEREYNEDKTSGKILPRSHASSSMTLAEEANDMNVINTTFTKNSLVFLVIGTMLLWFGWFGFNGGSALSANGKAVLACVNSNVAPCTALITWVILDSIFKGRPTVSGMCIAIICGLVGVTPAAGFVRVWAAGVIGILSAAIPYFFCLLRERYKFFDDRLDVFGCHGLGGIVGGVCTGLFYCDISATNECDVSSGIGSVYGSGSLLSYQLIGILATVSYSFIMSTLIFYAISKIFRIANIDDNLGVDKLDYHECALPETEFIIKKNKVIRG